jgi:hypothetical protein
MGSDAATRRISFIRVASTKPAALCENRCVSHHGDRKLIVNLNVKGAIPADYSKLTKLTLLDLSSK